MKYAIHGTTDEITVCECCGKKNLRNTVCLEEAATGEVKHFGSHCAARALGKGKGKADMILRAAKWRQRVLPVIELVKALVASGASVDQIKAEGNKVASKVWVNGGSVSVSGFASWGQINIDYCGGREVISL